MKGFETIIITKDEDGNDVTPYAFTRVCETSFVRNTETALSGRKHGGQLVSNRLPEGFAEAVDIIEEEVG